MEHISNSVRSTSLAALCAMGISCLGPEHEVISILTVISPGCGSILLDDSSSIESLRLDDGTMIYFKQEVVPDSYRHCRVFVDAQDQRVRIEYRDENVQPAQVDSCLVTETFVACNGSEPVYDNDVVAFGRSISNFITGLLPSSTTASTTTASGTSAGEARSMSARP